MRVKLTKFIMVMFCCVSVSGMVRAESLGEVNWEGVLYRGLYSYCQGNYQETYQQISKHVNELPPGPEVHKCLSLMRLAFVKVNNVPTPITKWNESATEYFKEIEGQVEPNELDLIVLAELKETPLVYDNNIATPILDKIMTSSSKWKDWAYWKKADNLSKQLRWVSLENEKDDIFNINDLGVYKTVLGNDIFYTCAVEKFPDKVLKARAAELFLKKYPDSYMVRQFELDYSAGYFHQTILALNKLDRFYNKRNSLVFGEVRKFAFGQVLADLKSIHDSLDSDKMAILKSEVQFEQFISTFGEDNRYAYQYLEQILEAKGKDALPKDIYEWVMSNIANNNSVLVPDIDN